MQINANSALRRVVDGAPMGTGPDNSKGALWILATTDAAATVETAGYLNLAVAQMRKGDIVIASMVLGGTPVSKTYVVSAVTTTVVTIIVQA